MSKTLEELGYEKEEDVLGIIYMHNIHGLKIFFTKSTQEIHLSTNEDMLASVTMEELKAIYKQCEDLGWI